MRRVHSRELCLLVPVPAPSVLSVLRAFTRSLIGPWFPRPFRRLPRASERTRSLVVRRRGGSPIGPHARLRTNRWWRFAILGGGLGECSLKGTSVPRALSRRMTPWGRLHGSDPKRWDLAP